MKGRYNYKAICVKVISGDTISAMVDLGFDVWISVNVRLFGIAAPDFRSKKIEDREKAMKSKKKLEEILTNKEFLLRSMDVGKNKRCLAEIIVDGINVNELLIKKGYARVFLSK
tara:strand:- start:11134 stop:11475 length:342 start_codon:yes stop_codon:yes gene_type:complete